eukprot:SM000361S13803  [mRNA]  locus=s361:9:786:+ [translate_table: standard]
MAPAAVTAAAALAAADAAAVAEAYVEQVVEIPMGLLAQHSPAELARVRELLEVEKRHLTAKLAELGNSGSSSPSAALPRFAAPGGRGVKVDLGVAADSEDSASEAVPLGGLDAEHDAVDEAAMAAAATVRHRQSSPGCSARRAHGRVELLGASAARRMREEDEAGDPGDGEVDDGEGSQQGNGRRGEDAAVNGGGSHGGSGS